MGTLKEYKGRADFSRSFFEVGGFDVIYPNGFANSADAVVAAIESKSKIVTICSADVNYTKLVSEMANELKEHCITVVIAGYPKEQIDELRKNGADEFIHVSADAYSILKKLIENYEL
jgi:methylmalonyl-CoA mutase